MSLSASTVQIAKNALREAYKERYNYLKGGESTAVIPIGLRQHPKRLEKPLIATQKFKHREQREKRVRANDQWWDKKPTVAGESNSPVHSRVSDPSTFTGFYRRRHQAGGQHAVHAVTGDFASHPLEAQNMLLSRSHYQLTIPGRAADFRSEVEWRMDLRPATRDSKLTLRHRLG